MKLEYLKSQIDLLVDAGYAEFDVRVQLHEDAPVEDFIVECQGDGNVFLICESAR